MPARAFTEPRPVSHGIGARARRRNAPTLTDLAAVSAGFDWDGRAKTLEDQLRGVFSVSGDMGVDLGEAVRRVRADRTYNEAFRRSFGRTPDVQLFLSAIVAFQTSLVDPPSRFDRFFFEGDSTALSDAERRGWDLFLSPKTGCAGCHSLRPDIRPGVMHFTDGSFHNLGVGYVDGRMADVGRYGITRWARDWGAFRTPSLRNVALTAPYMHDGSLKTLEDVIEFYLQGGIPNPTLDVVMSRRELPQGGKADLAAFLRALTSDSLLATRSPIPR